MMEIIEPEAQGVPVTVPATLTPSSDPGCYSCEHSPSREVTDYEWRMGRLSTDLECEDCGAVAQIVCDVDEDLLNCSLVWRDWA